MPQCLILLIYHPLWLVKFSTLSSVLPNHKIRGDVPMGEGGYTIDKSYSINLTMQLWLDPSNGGSEGGGLQGLEPIGYGYTLHKTDFEAQLKIMEGWGWNSCKLS